MLTASAEKTVEEGVVKVRVSGAVAASAVNASVQVYLDGKPTPAVKVNGGAWEVSDGYEDHGKPRLSWRLTTMPPPSIMVLVVASGEGARSTAKLLWV